ncbi:MAG: spermidine/putrescine ABC transporter substrate-binding protein [Ilumatobacter sp.]
MTSTSRTALGVRRTSTLAAQPRAVQRLAAGAVAVGLVATACGSDSNSDAASNADPAASCDVDQIDGDLAMFGWAEYIDPEQLEAFGEEFGIDTTYTVFDSNEAMQAVVSVGGSGHDVLLPSDYMVGIMGASGELLELDDDALPNIVNLRPDFTGLAYDPEGTWSVPYQSGTTGLAVDTAVLGEDFPRSWALIFDPAVSDEYAGKITMLNDPRETLGAALRYLGYSLNTTDAGELAEAQELVADSKSRLAAFDSVTADELLTSGETAIAHGFSGDLFVQFLDTDDPERYQYFVPEEGGAKWVDTLAIPFDAPHPCTAHTFINWLLDAENGAELTNWNYYTTPNAAAEAGLEDELLEFVNDPATVAGGDESLEIIVDTGDFELEYTDAFINAKG